MTYVTPKSAKPGLADLVCRRRIILWRRYAILAILLAAWRRLRCETFCWLMQSRSSPGRRLTYLASTLSSLEHSRADEAAPALPKTNDRLGYALGAWLIVRTLLWTYVT